MAVLENCYLTKTLPNLTFPDQFSIAYPNSVGASLILTLPGATLPIP